MEQIELEEYLSNGVQKIVKGMVQSVVKNPRASMFMMQHSLDSKKARRKRQEAELTGEHIPPFLIASITEQCNLHCKGCYARETQGCNDHCSQDMLLKDKDWNEIFSQAEDLGIEFILLAGGEPFVRKDVIETAGKHSRILFPIFTNGTMINEDYIKLLDQKRNLLPVVSIEGSKETTDNRRGEGVYDRLQSSMGQLQQKGIMYGASVTVSKNNQEEVFSDKFVAEIREAGAKAIVYVEFVPMNEAQKDLAIDDRDRSIMMERLDERRKKDKDMVFVAFPGDEKTSGGCLAAGRGFFHINARGGAEPCPFSPYSDTNVLDVTLKEALHSPLFRKLQQNGNLTEEHIGGCVLFEQKNEVEKMLSDAK